MNSLPEYSSIRDFLHNRNVDIVRANRNEEDILFPKTNSNEDIVKYEGRLPKKQYDRSIQNREYIDNLNKKNTNIVERDKFIYELDELVTMISKKMDETNLTKAESIAMKNYMNSIRGLQNSGNNASAYVMAKKAVTYLTGASFREAPKSDPSVEIKFSDKVEMFKPFAKDNITTDTNLPDSMKKGLYLNREI